MKKGVFLINLGSPKSPTKEDVRVYLDEFLMDPRVVDLPQPLRSILVRGIILNTRPKKSAAAYAKVWTDEGSPLIVFSERVKSKLEVRLDGIPVALGMRYGEPSIERGLNELAALGVDDVLVVPLYPQYAMSTTETVVEKECKGLRHFTRTKVTSLPWLHLLRRLRTTKHMTAFYFRTMVFQNAISANPILRAHTAKSMAHAAILPARLTKSATVISASKRPSLWRRR